MDYFWKICLAENSELFYYETWRYIQLEYYTTIIVRL